MTTYTLNPMTARNAGDAREWAVCARLGVERTAHDAQAYDKASDVEANGHGYSVKASGATLMSGNLCNGLEDFEAIWNLFADNTHSDRFVYVAINWKAYEMSLAEFGEFVHQFGRCERESSKNGGAMKIRLRKESSKMVTWLDRHVA